tara:strand:+ start:819 stop:1256 length:438 start_codon:yes stop_codon:yes gene_type:complete
MNGFKTWDLKKMVLPQHTDHAGVMWHGTYLNWLEESRIDSFNKAGIQYIELLNKGFEMPVYKLEIKYLIPIMIGDEIIIKSYFIINKGPRIKVNSTFTNLRNNIHAKASIDIVLINKETFKIIRKRPDFVENYLNNLSEIVKDKK